MGFQGEVLPIGSLLEHSMSSASQPVSSKVGVRHTAAGNAAYCGTLLKQGDTAESCWRFGILQTLDDYTSTLRRGGAELASQVFTDEPLRTGSREVDAAFAALADHLASRDGWQVPEWALDPAKTTNEWFPAVPSIFRDEALRDSPRAFRQRGIFITARSLLRA